MYYVKAKRSLKIDGTKQERYVAKIYRGKDVSQEELCREISYSSSLTEGDVSNCIKQFLFYIQRHIAEGRAVQTSFGKFIPAIRSKSVKDAKDVDAEIITRAYCRFYESSQFKSEMKFAPLEFKDLTKVNHA